jgi:hypothetical protein
MAGKVREGIEPEGDKFGDLHLFWRLGPAHLGARGIDLLGAAMLVALVV